ncbi:hypothetical protein IM880_10600 [Pectobacterium polaris]|uniref:Uncharacterized protein n=1 Tax=Pectobacterium polaris TaxID=2042057 RepID=A0AAW4P032_9GAMM|nr:hypothetical protein [Pectobacterium polaris]MBW5892660.1 hypothetical protein [Pectobacterium polaris]
MEKNNMKISPTVVAYTQTNTVGKGIVEKDTAMSANGMSGEAAKGEGVHVSSLARQLSEAATRATARETSTDRDGLAVMAKSITEKLIGMSYEINKKDHDAEVPKTDDPELLARARQATDFLNDKGANPFKGLSREQLALITYDESGTFTVNERRAAWVESYDQEQQWRQMIAAKMMDDYNRTGEISSHSLSEVLKHYKSLPAIEEAQQPKGYDIQLWARIQLQESGRSSSRDIGEWNTILDRLMGSATPLQSENTTEVKFFSTESNI